MYAIKEAVIAKEHASQDLDATIFYMDMRTCGKAFETYRERAEEEHGVSFIRSRIHTVEPVGNGDLKIVYADESGALNHEVFNLVVLSVGFQVAEETMALAQRLNVPLNQNRFAQTDDYVPVMTDRPGVYVCGALQGPKDIPESVVEASAAAAVSEDLLHTARWSRTRDIEMPEERNVAGDRPRIGVFVCQCGINIGGIVDIASVREYARGLPYVTYVEDNLYTCSQDTQVKMADVIREQGINRVVVAACTPKTHEGLFQETLQNAGLNKYLFEMANIRNQDSWVHSNDPERATEKAKDLVRMAVAKVGLLEPLQETELNMNPAALVIGGGMAGMTAAQNLATQGYDVHLVERSDTLGGQAQRLHQTWKGKPVSKHLERITADIENSPRIHVHLLSEIAHVDGFVGNFSTTVREKTGEDITIDHGVAVVATGAREFQTDEYLHGKDPRVLTHQELDDMLRAEDPMLKAIRSAAFIQCVGSREPARPYCSRVCCTHTLRSALQLKKRQPDMAIYVLYRDLRTYGEREDLYNEARQKGIVFVRYDLAHKPKIEAKEEALEIEVWDPVLQNSILIRTDLLGLATAIVPEDNRKLAQFFKLPVGEDGFFVEAHAKLRPVDFSTDGVFLCGLAHYPKSIDESIAQALAASARAATFLASDNVHVGGTVAEVQGNLCSRCGVCIDICAFKAPFFTEEGPAAVNAALCKGCGLCVSSCRSGALRLKGFNDQQMLAMIQQC